MNIALIFAGGTGTRMNSKAKPKQFLELHGKAIIIYTLEIFEQHKEIDAIIVVCLKEWISYLEQLIKKADLNKVVVVVAGGESAQESQYLGLCACEKYLSPDPKSTILIHDGVRPLVNNDTISKNISGVKSYGNAITVTPAIETVISVEDDKLTEVLDRNRYKMAKAPQSFHFEEILKAHKKARKDNLNFIDSASLMYHYGYILHAVEGSSENIKITTPADFYIFRAITDAKENSQIWGLE